MATIDLYCAPDDQHRVVLLVDLLKEAGRAVMLRPAPAAVPSNPCIVACTARALREPWIRALFETAPTLVALRLDDTPLPGPCARAIAMQNWPARSADRKVGALVDWLLRHGPPLELADPATTAAGRSTRAPAVAGHARRRPRGERAAETWRNLAVLALLVVGGMLLLWAAPEQRGRTDAEPVSAQADPVLGARSDSAADASANARPPAAGPAKESAVAGFSADAAAPRADGPAATSLGGSGGGDTAGAATPPAPSAMRVAVSAETSPAQRSDTGGTPQAREPAPAAGDALAHLCEARTLAAATAWAGALNWKQRRRLPDEPCVERLLARPGFAGLAVILRRS